jgi:bifunctional non-homologous end joining protein LigD
MKRDPEADFAICGYTAPKNTRTGFGALHLCVWDEERWVWAGRVGSGFDDQQLRDLKQVLDDKPTWKPTFPRPEAAPTRSGSSPELVVQVRYREWPLDSALRFPVFERLRATRPRATASMPPAAPATIRWSEPRSRRRSSSNTTRRCASCGSRT